MNHNYLMATTPSSSASTIDTSASSTGFMTTSSDASSPPSSAASFDAALVQHPTHTSDEFSSTNATAPPLFEEYYDDWAAFDHAVAQAIAKHHPIRKRSSLTFEVYNRTVSKGRHDRKCIAEFLSKTFKCTHGIKFRSRGNGKRLRHKLRDIGCPFHLYASAVEFGATYRVKVRMHDQHNHPIGPDAIKTMQQAIPESEYDVMTPSQAANLEMMEQHSHTHGHHTHSSSLEHVVHALVQNHQQQAQLQEAQEVTQPKQHEFVQATSLHIMHEPSAAAPSASTTEVTNDLLVTAQDNEALLASAMAVENPMVVSAFASVPTSPRPPKFQDNMTLEGLRQSIAHFAAERDWDQFHTPRNLLLAMTGEVGELCEIFQWKGDDKPVDEWSLDERVHLGEELSDVIIYLIRLADKCNVDLPAAIRDKMVKNARKYPADLVRGSSKKYNEIKRMRLDRDGHSSSSSTGDRDDHGTSTTI